MSVESKCLSYLHFHNLFNHLSCILKFFNTHLLRKSSVAQNIQLNDNNLPPLYFEKLNSTDSIKVNSIPPNGKVIDTLVFKPKIGTHGRVNFTSAEVVYQSKDSSTVLRTLSSEPGYAYILSSEDFQKRFSFHLVSLICSRGL